MSGNADKGAKPPGIVEFLFNELRHAFQDIRQKLVEEGWFGRVTTARPVVEVSKEQPLTDDRELARQSRMADLERRPTFEELWGPRERSPEAAEHEPERGMDLDR